MAGNQNPFLILTFWKHPLSDNKRKTLQNLILFVIYFITARLGLKLGAVGEYATLIWPPTGIALAALILFGHHLWPGIALGAFVVNWTVGAPLPVALSMSIGNTLEAVVGTYLLQNTGFHPSMNRLRWVFSLILFAALFSALISATFGVTSLWLFGALTAPYSSTWKAWWLGDVMGGLVVAPFFLVWSTGVRFSKEPKRIIEGITLAVLVAMGTAFIFSDLLTFGAPAFPRPYLAFPILMLVAVRLGQVGTVTSVFAISVFAIGATATRHGQFWTGSLSESLFEVQIFLGVVATSKMALAAAISERNQEKHALAESNTQKKAILDSALDCIVTIDPKGQIVEFNFAAERTFGYTRADVVGKEMAGLLIPPKAREAHRKGLAHYLATGEGPLLGHRLEMSAMKADKTEFPVELSIVALGSERPAMFTGFIRDISERKLAEESQRFLAEGTKILSESIEYTTTLKHVAKAAVPGLGDWCIVQIIGEDGKVQVIELACTSPEKEVMLRPQLSRYMTDLYSPTLTSSVVQTKKSCLVTHFSDEIYRPLGADQELLAFIKQLGIQSLMVSPLCIHDKILGTITIVSDNTGRRYRQQDLTIFEELARRAAIAIENARLYHEAQAAILARDEFLSIASHELKTPLTSLSLQLQMFNKSLRQRLPSQWFENQEPDLVLIPIRLAKSIGSCEAQSRKLAALLNELLDLTRIRLGRLHLERAIVDLGVLVKEVVGRFKVEASQKGVTVSIQCTTPILGSWDSVRIEQVVTNLISNAIKYGEGKSVSVIVNVDKVRHVAKLAVQDQGIGVPKNMRERIFERFERAGASERKIEGLGLGLYISRQIIEAHGGSIQVKSVVHKGSTFTVEIPLSLPAMRGPIQIDSSQAAGRKIKTAG